MTTRLRARPMTAVLAAVSIPMFMVTLDNLVVTTALPVIKEELGASLTDLQWFVNAYTLSFAALLLTAAAVGDRIGRRRLFLAGIALFTVASAACALATEPWQLTAARAVQGAAGAAVMPLSLTLLAAAVPPGMRNAAVGIWGGISGLGVAVGPVVGGAVAEGLHWTWIFWLNVPVGLLALPLAAAVLRESRGGARRLDPAGLVLSSAAVLAMVWGITHGADHGWTAPETLTAIVGGAALLAVFLAWERRAPAPMLPLRLFRNRGFSVVNAVALLFSAGVFGAVFLLAQFLQVVQGMDPFEAGVRTLPWTMAPMVVAPLAGLVLLGRFGARTLIVTGQVLLAVALGWAGGRQHGRHRVRRPARPVRPRGCRHGTRVRADEHARAGVGAGGRARGGVRCPQLDPRTRGGRWCLRTGIGVRGARELREPGGLRGRGPARGVGGRGTGGGRWCDRAPASQAGQGRLERLLWIFVRSLGLISSYLRGT
jgi:EmrB/QacA subfamily drug resistance transporter